jgi:stage V sporulation protein SpoVS
MKVFRVGAKTDPNKLGYAIYVAVKGGEDVTVRAVGPYPVLKAIRGCISANKLLAPNAVSFTPEYVKEGGVTVNLFRLLKCKPPTAEYLDRLCDVSAYDDLPLHAGP